MTIEEILNPEISKQKILKNSEKREKALDWLEKQLSSGPRLADDLKKLVKNESFSWPTVQRARQDSCIKFKKEELPGGKFGPTTWFLPDSECQT